MEAIYNQPESYSRKVEFACRSSIDFEAKQPVEVQSKRRPVPSSGDFISWDLSKKQVQSEPAKNRRNPNQQSITETDEPKKMKKYTQQTNGNIINPVPEERKEVRVRAHNVSSIFG